MSSSVTSESSEYEVLDSGNYENSQSSSTNEYSECQTTDSGSKENSQQSDGSVCIVFAKDSGVELSAIYDFHEIIGEGGFATVHKVTSRSDDKHYAAKEFKISDNKIVEEVKKEVGYLVSLEPHANVIRYYCTLFKKKDVGMKNSMCYIVMDLCTRSLYHYLDDRRKKKKQVDENFNNSLKFQLLSGLDYIHGKNVIHRDIKPKNIFLKENANKTIVVLGDFGLACDQQSSSKNSKDNWNKIRGVGTVTYSAPEQLNSSNYTFLVDIYSSGLVLFEAYCMCETVTERSLCFEELRNERSISNPSMEPWQEEVIMILKMTASESYRPTASELLEELQAYPKNMTSITLDLGHLPINGDVSATALETLCQQLQNVIRTEEDIKIVQKRLDEIKAKFGKSTQ